MHIWSALAVREASLLAMLLLLGAGPASFLPERIDLIGRIALAPVLGFCVGTCVTTTVLEFAPVGDTYWLLLPLAVASASVGTVRVRRHLLRGRSPWMLRATDVAALLFVCVVVAVPTSRVLHQHQTVGPAAFNTTDVDNYVGVQDAAQTTDLIDARRSYERYLRTGIPPGDLTQFVWSENVYADGNLDATPLAANLNALLGLGASDTWAPFLIVLQLAGGLGAFAAVRYLTESPTWTAALAGGMFGGPFFIELWFDGFQAAVVALGLLMPLVVLGLEALRERAPATLVLLALLLATMLSVYPLFVPLLLLAAAIVLGWRLVSARRAGGSVRAVAVAALPSIALVAVLSIVFDPVGFGRDVSYYQGILSNTIALPRLNFDLPPDVIPGWVAQTREFWYMPNFGTGGFSQLLTGFLIPLVFLGLIVVGLRRYPRALALVVLAGVCGIVAVYSYHSRSGCTYCAERNLLPLAPIAAVLIALGLAALIALPRRGWKLAGVAGALLLVIAVGDRARVELNRFSEGSYFVDSANRAVLSHVPRGTGAVQVEGYGASSYAQSEQPLVYHLVNERAPGRASIILGSSDGNGLQYLDISGVVHLPPGREFQPGYEYVLTRLAGVRTSRQLIARSGSIALERRAQPLDVTPYAGFSTNLARLNPLGVAWPQPPSPLSLFVTGWNGGRPVWARLTFLTREPVTVPPQAGVRARQVGSTLTACVRATGREPIRQVTLRLSAVPDVPPPPPGFARPMPSEGIALTGMYAVTGDCRV